MSWFWSDYNYKKDFDKILNQLKNEYEEPVYRPVYLIERPSVIHVNLMSEIRSEAQFVIWSMRMQHVLTEIKDTVYVRGKIDNEFLTICPMYFVNVYRFYEADFQNVLKSGQNGQKSSGLYSNDSFINSALIFLIPFGLYGSLLYISDMFCY